MWAGSSCKHKTSHSDGLVLLRTDRSTSGERRQFRDRTRNPLLGLALMAKPPRYVRGARPGERRSLCQSISNVC